MNNDRAALAPAKEAKNDIRSMLAGETFKRQVALALPKHMTPDRFARVALTALTRTPKLLDCTRESLLKCLMDCSQLGLEPDGRNAHLIPYENRKLGIVECQMIIDWKGLVALARRSGEVAVFRAELVKREDHFEWRNGEVTHLIDWRRDRGETECVYSYVKFKDGAEDWEVMTLAEVNAIRSRSRAANAGPWVTDFDEMAKKTAIRRHSKRLTLSPEFRDALEKDGDQPGERVTTGREVPPAEVPAFLAAPVPEQSSRLEASADQQGREPADAKTTGRKSTGGAPELVAAPDVPPSEAAEPKAVFWDRVKAAQLDDVTVLGVVRRNNMTQAEWPADLTNEDAEALLVPKMWSKLLELAKAA